MSSNPNVKPAGGVLTPAEAVGQYEEAVKTQPTAANYLELGAAYYIAHRWDDAVRAFEKTLELDPKQAYAHYYLGILHAAMGQRDKANADLEQVLQHSTSQMLKDQARTRIPGVKSIADLGGN
jgi:tetratricopeptide (TPR) repeat protein